MNQRNYHERFDDAGTTPDYVASELLYAVQTMRIIKGHRTDTVRVATAHSVIAGGTARAGLVFPDMSSPMSQDGVSSTDRC